jgi:GTPase SAR1 family protein
MLKKLTETGYNYKKNETATIGVDFYTDIIQIKNYNNIKLHIWDTSGNGNFKKIVTDYYKNNAICYVFYDVCNYSSFRAVSNWITHFKLNNFNPNVIIVILANKTSDTKKRVVSFELGKGLAHTHDAIYIEMLGKVSSDKLFTEPINKLFNIYEQKKYTSTEIIGLTVLNKNKIEYKKKRCCAIL